MDKTLKNRGKNFKIKFFTKKEIKYCDGKKNSGSFYAKRFAAKEALTKALGTGIRKGINLKDIQISNDIYGKPAIKLKGNVDKFLKKKINKKKYKINLALSDDKPWAQAAVIITHN